jgi:peroxiredoxin Q/BCP
MAKGVGDPAPDFELSNQDGKSVRLSALWKRGPVVLYFYPKDETPGCTAEACSFRDSYEDFQHAGAQVVGVSSDSADSHAKFATHHKLPFTLLADPGSKVRSLYEVPRALLGFLPGRVTYVIDESGVVRHVFNSMINATRHVREALEVVRSLAQPPGATA